MIPITMPSSKTADSLSPIGLVGRRGCSLNVVNWCIHSSQCCRYKYVGTVFLSICPTDRFIAAGLRSNCLKRVVSHIEL